MRFTVSSPSPLCGRINIPGDHRLTLTLIALGMSMEAPLTLITPSSAQDVLQFRAFLERNGASIYTVQDGFTLTGRRFSGDVVLSVDVPDAIFHITAASAVFTARTVRIAEGAAVRSRIVEPFLALLKQAGVRDDCVTVAGRDVIVQGSLFSPSELVRLKSQWAVEAVIAGALAARTPVTVSLPGGMLPLPERILRALGFVFDQADGAGNIEAELERRKSRASGDKPVEIRTIGWGEPPVGRFEIPGDTTVAAAVAGCAAVVQRSDVTILNVMWDGGRRGFFDTLRRMKARISYDCEQNGHFFDTADIRIGWSVLEGVHVTPDQAETMATELLVLAVVAASASGETVISDLAEPPGVGREAFKLVARALVKCGVHIGDFTEGIVLRGGTEFNSNEVDSGGRPDVACALVVAGMAAAGETTVLGCENDVYPVGDFLEIVRQLSDSSVSV